MARKAQHQQIPVGVIATLQDGQPVMHLQRAHRPGHAANLAAAAARLDQAPPPSSGEFRAARPAVVRLAHLFAVVMARRPATRTARVQTSNTPRTARAGWRRLRLERDRRATGRDATAIRARSFHRRRRCGDKRRLVHRVSRPAAPSNTRSPLQSTRSRSTEPMHPIKTINWLYCIHRASLSLIFQNGQRGSGSLRF